MKNIDSNASCKNAIYMPGISNNNTVSARLIPIIIEECVFVISAVGYKQRRVNIVLDNFEYLVPFQSLQLLLSISRPYNIKFSAFIGSLLDLVHTYGPEEAELLPVDFCNRIYLLASDNQTLQRVSDDCGKVETENGLKPLITVDELKLLDVFEAIIITNRMYPIKTKFLPDYEINWQFSEEKIPFKEIKKNDIKTYKIK